MLLLAAVNFFVGLGGSSLFIDESLSWSDASSSLRDLWHHASQLEITPPTYFAGLHEWIGRGSDTEAFMRLPSAVAGVAVVAALVWVGTRLASRRVGLAAGALAALSPLLLEYAQQARAYVFAMLLTTVAVGAYLEFDRRSDGRRRTYWLIVLTATSIAAVWVHYTAGLVLAPLLGLGLARRSFRRGEGIAAVGAVVLGWLALLPTLRDQLSHGNQKGIAPAAGLTADNLVQSIGAPFDGRFGGEDLSFWTGLGAAALVAAAVVVARSRAPEAERLRRLALPLAYTVVPVLVAVTIAGSKVLITRYTAVAAPLMLVVLAGGAFLAPRVLGVSVAAVALVSAVAGSIGAHSYEGQYSDIRAANRQIAAGARPTDLVAVVGPPGSGILEGYYLRRFGLDGKVRLLEAGGLPPARPGGRPRLWLIRTPPVPRSQLERGLGIFSYRPAAVWRYTAGYDEQLILAVPRRP